VDGLASALSVLAQFENNRSMESDLLQELADFVAVELQVKQAAWIDKISDGPYDTPRFWCLRQSS
jgi:hypothetical protein